MRVFVTGGTGLIGVRLVRALRRRGDECARACGSAGMADINRWARCPRAPRDFRAGVVVRRLATAGHHQRMI
jgi:nucleoside-diphosphate-sugar epimerase